MVPGKDHSGTSDDRLWYKDAIIYEVHVRAFCDDSGDGMGDFAGLTRKLDYLQDLGITAIWLLPFFPSPWRDDGYDISDYTRVHPAYGTQREFQNFLRGAHQRGLRVVTEIVLNHTSDQHPWFRRSRRATRGSKWRDFYVWSDNPDMYKDARIIFKDFEASNWTWDPVAKAYYWHRFYSHQPDLNFDSARVREAILDVADFWLDLGVDGLRLDAVPYLYEREGTNCENLPETHAFLKELRRRVESRHSGCVLLAEANQWPEDAIAYFGEDDECQMAFHFPLMPRLFMATRMEDRFPIIEIMQQTPPISPNCQWATFLRNHDELTLEMVTDEDRDYMYRVYAHERQMRINLGIRRRLAPLLGNDRKSIELMNILLFSLPGTPVIYYGDEIGMGDNIYLGDRNGVRTPMQWSADRNAGFSRANPQKLYLPINIDPEYHYEAVNVETQQNNPNSLMWWMRRLITQRKQHKAFGRGTVEFLLPENRHVLAFLRRYEAETLLIVANLSRFPQHVELDLAEFKGLTPVEAFGGAEFPPIGESPYVITLGSHGFYWFSVEKRRTFQEAVDTTATDTELPLIVEGEFVDILHGSGLTLITRLLPAFLKTRRWFQGKGRRLQSVQIEETIPVPETNGSILLARVVYPNGETEMYVLPGAFATGPAAENVATAFPDAIVVQVRAASGSTGVLYGAMWDREFCAALLNAIGRRRRIRGRSGELAGVHARAFRDIWGPDHPRLDSAVVKAEQMNSSVTYGDRFILKIFRRVEPGVHPEIEIGEFLARHEITHSTPLAGFLEYRTTQGESVVIASLHGYVPNNGDAWQFTLDSLSQYFEAGLAHPSPETLRPPADHPLLLARLEMPPQTRELIGAYVESARLMGLRLAELHVALASDKEDPDFAPEALTEHDRLSLYHGMISGAVRSLEFLREQVSHLSPDTQPYAQKVLEMESEVRAFFRPVRDRRLTGFRIRQHGHMQLRQLLHTGKDFVVIDFEGDPRRPLSERRLKRPALSDIAGMIRSFQYAAHAVLFGLVTGIAVRPEDASSLEPLADHWHTWVSGRFLAGYLEVAGGQGFLPETEEETSFLLDAFRLERALFELRRELSDRPGWVRIPLYGILGLLQRAKPPGKVSGPGSGSGTIEA